MSFTRYRSQQKDIQEQNKLGLFGDITYLDGGGAYTTIRGTGIVDQEVPLLNTGYGFNLPSNSNAEMLVFSMGSDVNAKMALATIPRNLQYTWGEGQGGIQSPVDPNRRIEFNDDGMWLKDGTYTLGHEKAVKVTISGSSVTIELTGDTNIKTAGDLVLEAASIEMKSATLKHNGKDIGDTHRHGGVDTGGGTSGVPV
jgi:hypothetical protein